MALPTQQWIDTLSDRIGTQSLLLALGALLVLALGLLVYLSIRGIVRAVRMRAAMSTFSPNPVMDRSQDDEPPSLAELLGNQAGVDDSVAFAKKMAQIQQQFKEYNDTLTGYGQEYGLSVQSDLLDTGVFNKASVNYATKPSN